METTRQEKISRLLQKDLSDIFLHYAREHQGVLISVSEVRVTTDLSIARVYLSIFPSAKGEEMVEQIVKDSKSIRYELGKRVRHQLRIVPELNFYKDDSIDKLEQIDTLLNATREEENQ